MYYIDIDRKNACFVIKETLTQKPFVTVPTYILEPIYRSAQGPVINKFRFVGNDKINVITMDGREKLFNFKNNFEEIAYNVIPMFDPKESEVFHYFTSRPALTKKDVTKRLKRKYQLYKTHYYLFNHRDVQTMYP